MKPFFEANLSKKHMYLTVENYSEALNGKKRNASRPGRRRPGRDREKDMHSRRVTFPYNPQPLCLQLCEKVMKAKES
jgi:hypothetical protein